MAKEDEIYYRLIRDYYTQLATDANGHVNQQRVDQIIAQIQMGDEMAPRTLAGNPPIQTSVSPSEKSVIRWVEDAHTIHLLGMISEGGKIGREDVAFARGQQKYFEEAIAAGKVLQSSVNEHSKPFLEALTTRLARRNPPINIHIDYAPPRDGVGFGEWQNVTIVPSVVDHGEPHHAATIAPVDQKSAEIQEAFAAHAAALGLKPVELPFESMCIDGLPFSRDNYMASGIDGHIPHAVDEPEERLKDMGTYRYSHGHGTFSWVDGEGKTYVARDIDSNVQTIKRAGYRFQEGASPLYTRSLIGANREKWHAIMDVPENAQERLENAIKKGDLAEINAAVDAGARIADCINSINTGRDPAAFLALRNQSQHEDHDAVMRRLLPESQLVREDQYYQRNLLHEMMQINRDYSAIIPEAIRAGADPFALNSSRLPAALEFKSGIPPGVYKKNMNALMDAMIATPGLTVPERRILLSQRAFINAHLDQDIAELPSTEGHRENFEKVNIPEDMFHHSESATQQESTTQQAIWGLGTIWRKAHEAAFKAEPTDHTSKIPPMVTQVIDGLLATSHQSVITNAQAAELLDPLRAVARDPIELISKPLVSLALKSTLPGSDRLVPIFLATPEGPFAEDHYRQPALLDINPMKPTVRTELAAVVAAMEKAHPTSEETCAIQGMHAFLDSHLEHYTLESVNSINDAITSLGNLWWVANKQNEQRIAETRDAKIPPQVTCVINRLLEPANGQASTSAQKAALLEPLLALAEEHDVGAHHLTFNALKSLRPGDRLLRALLQTYDRPFAEDGNGVPLFLRVNPDKETAHTELSLVVAAMKERKLTPEEVRAVDAMHAYLDTQLSNKEHIKDAASGLANLWKNARHDQDQNASSQEEATRPVPPKLTHIINRLLESANGQDISEAELLKPVMALCNRSEDYNSLLLNALESNHPAGRLLPILMDMEGAFARNDLQVPAFLHVNEAKETARKELTQVVKRMRSEIGTSDSSKPLLETIGAQHQAILAELDKLDQLKAKLQIVGNIPPPVDLPEIAPATEGDHEKLRETFNRIYSLKSGLASIWREEELHAGGCKVPPTLADLLKPLETETHEENKKPNLAKPQLLDQLYKYESRGSNADDVVREFTTRIVLPQVIAEYSKQTGLPLTDENLKYFNEKTQALINALQPKVRQKLFRDASLTQREGLSETWHSIDFPDRLVPIKASGEWYPLTAMNAYVVRPNGGAMTIAANANHEHPILIMPDADSVTLQPNGENDTLIRISKAGTQTATISITGQTPQQVGKRLTFVEGIEQPQLIGTQEHPKTLPLSTDEIAELQSKSSSSSSLIAEKVPLRIIEVPKSAFPDTMFKHLKEGEGTGIKLIMETTFDRLQHLSESDVMDHCVGRSGSYSSQCLAAKPGDAFTIISIDEEGHLNPRGKRAPLTTLGANWNSHTEKFKVEQNKGYKNAVACEGMDYVPDGTEEYLAKAKYAELWLKKQLESGAIATSPELGETKTSKIVNARPEILKTIGFELHSPETDVTTANIDACFEEYRQPNRTARAWNLETHTFDQGVGRFGDEGYKAPVTTEFQMIRPVSMRVMGEDGNPVTKVVKTVVRNAAGEIVYHTRLAPKKQGHKVVTGEDGEPVYVEMKVPEHTSIHFPVYEDVMPKNAEQWIRMNGLQDAISEIVAPHVAEAKQQLLLHSAPVSETTAEQLPYRPLDQAEEAFQKHVLPGYESNPLIHSDSPRGGSAASTQSANDKPITLPLEPNRDTQIEEFKSEESQTHHFGKTWGQAGLVSRLANINEKGSNNVDKVAIGFDAVGMLSKNEELAAHSGGIGQELGVVSQTIKGYHEEGMGGATREGGKGGANTVVGNALFSSKETKDVGVAMREAIEPTKALAKAMPVALQKGYTLLTKVAARKSSVALVGTAFSNLKNGSLLANVSKNLTFDSAAKLGAGGVNFAGQAGLLNGFIKASGDGLDYATGKKAFTKENGADTTISTVMALDPVNAVTSMVGIKNVSVEKGVGAFEEKVFGVKTDGQTLSEMGAYTTASYAQATNIQAGEINRPKDKISEVPTMQDYQHLAAVRSQVAQYIPGGKIDGHDVIKEFKKIDMTKPENYEAYSHALNQAAVAQDQIMQQNSAPWWLPRTMYFGQSADVYNRAEVDMKIFETAQEECGQFIAKIHTYNKTLATQTLASNIKVNPSFKNPVNGSTIVHCDPSHSIQPSAHYAKADNGNQQKTV